MQTTTTKLLLLMSLIRWKDDPGWHEKKEAAIGNEIIYFKEWLKEHLQQIPDDTVRDIAIRFWLKGEKLDARKADFTFLERARLALQMVYASEMRVVKAVNHSLDEFLYDLLGDNLYYVR